MARGSALAFLPALACVWKTESEYLERLDQDRDGVPGAADCNDDARGMHVLEAWTGAITCGDTVRADVFDGTDRLEFVNCLHPIHDGDLVELGLNEHVWRFEAATATDVVVEMDASEFWLNTGESDTDDLAMVAFRGPTCAVDACVPGLPVAPGPRPEGHRDWRPAVRFTAAPEESWYVVVSGGCWPNTTDLGLLPDLEAECATVFSSPYELTVACEE